MKILILVLALATFDCLARTLGVQNQTASPHSYLSGTVVVPASSSVSVSDANQFSLAEDGQFRSDCGNNIVQISDGVTQYGTTDCITYLDNITRRPTNTFTNSRHALDVFIASGSTIGAPDKSSFIEGSTVAQTIAGVYAESFADLADGTSGTPRLTAKRAFHTNLRNSSGIEVGTASTPIRTDPTGTTPQPSSQSGTWTTARSWTLGSGTDSVTSIQGTSPWVSSISNFPATQAVTQSGTWTVQQGTPPWSVAQSGTWSTGRTWNLSFASDKADVSGSSVSVSNFPSTYAVTQSTSPWVTSRNWTLSNSTDSVASVQSGTWTTGRTWSLSSGSDSVTAVGSGNFTVVQPTGTNLHTVVDSSALPTGAATESTLSAFKTANHTDVSQVDTDVLAFKSANHTDLIATEPRNLAQVNGVTVSTGTGVSGTGTQRVTLAADGQKTMGNGTAVTLASDQSGINTYLDKSGSGTISALNGRVTATTNGMNTVVFSITGTFTATYFFKGVKQDGTEAYLYADSLAFGSDIDSQNFALSPGTFVVNCAGFATVALVAEAYTSGTINVGWNAGSGVRALKVYNPTAANFNATAQITDGTNIATVKAASTAPVATDKALVVVESPNGNHALAANQTNGTQKTKIVDASGNVFGPVQSDGAGNNAVPVNINSTNFVFSSGNSSTAQLAAGATFPGAIETVIAQQAYSILLTSDQNGTLTIKQCIDAACARVAQTLPFSVTANVGFSRSGVLNGNYFLLSFTNNGGSTTTTLNINTYYGTLPSSTQLNNAPMAINEVNGTSLTAVNNSLPVSSNASNNGTPTESSVSCGNTSTTLLAAAAASKFITIRNPSTATVIVWINVAGASATTAAPSIDLVPGAEADFRASENSYLPTAQLNCISTTGSSSLTLVYK